MADSFDSELDESGFGFGQVPDGEQSRAFLQRRLAFFGRTGALLSFSFYAVSATLRLALQADFTLGSTMFAEETRFNLETAAMFGGLWLACRRGSFSRATLERFDAAITVLATIAYSWMVQRGKGDTPLFVPVLCTLATLMARAVFVPSTPGRTFRLSIVASLPSILSAYAWASSMDSPLAATLKAAEISIWGGLIVALSTLASRVVYGLEAQVRKARQLGQYTLVERIGSGGMGVVYRAEHALLRRPTAVKVLPAEKVAERTQRRFEREVQLTSALTHPNTIAIYDYGHTPDGLFYYAMEYLEGFTLYELSTLCGPLPPARVANIMRQASGSLDEAHRVGLIHRDIKPDNILLCDRGGLCDVVKVLDFGLVKDLREAADPTLSQVDTIVGTPLFMSPETITTPENVGASSDIYALGCVAYYLLTGRHVFEANSLVEICSHHLLTPPEPPSRVLGRALPPALEALVLRCLAKKPEERPASARELERAFGESIAGDAFSQDDARAWWAEHRKDLKRQHAAPVTPFSAPVTRTIQRDTKLSARDVA